MGLRPPLCHLASPTGKNMWCILYELLADALPTRLATPFLPVAPLDETVIVLTPTVTGRGVNGGSRPRPLGVLVMVSYGLSVLPADVVAAGRALCPR